MPGLWDSRLAGGRGAVVGEGDETTLTVSGSCGGGVMGTELHYSLPLVCLKISAVKTFSELDYNFPKEILQTVINRTEYVTQAYLIHNEAGLWNTNYHCLYVKTFQNPAHTSLEITPQWKWCQLLSLASVKAKTEQPRLPARRDRRVCELDTRDEGTARS